MMRGFENIAGIGSVTGADDDGEVQHLQVTEKAAGSGFMARVLDKVARLFSFGFTSVPPLGAEVLMLRLGGDRNCSIAISTNHRPSRPKGLQPGDSAMYDVRGAIISMTADGIIIEAAGAPVTIRSTSGVHIEGPLTVDGDITGLNGSDVLALSTIRSTFNGHKHTGVQTGSGTSANTNTDL